MKSFLILFLICTSGAALAELPPPKGGITLGTIQMWSDWYPGAAEVDLSQICTEVCKSYNEMNRPRGYWGRLLKPEPVNLITYVAPDGEVHKQFYCHLRVKRFDLSEEE